MLQMKRITMDVGVRSALQILAPSFSMHDSVAVLGEGRSTVLCVAEQIIIKRSETAITEAETMNYVRKHTSIPIPKVYGTHANESGTYIVMEYVPCDTLYESWDKLSQFERDSLAQQLKSIVNQLGNISEDYVGAVNRRPFVSDILVPSSTTGPFNSQHEFHDFLVDLYRHEKPLSHFGSLLRKLLKDDYKLVFCHGDLNPSNIVIQDGHVVSVIDWEMGGFYPQYWEYARACLEIHWTKEFMPGYVEFIHSFMEKFRAEAWIVGILDSSWKRIN